jgi:FkbM family methyltransferase
MVEAQSNKEEILKNLSEVYLNVDYAIALLSANDGEEKLFLEDETISQVIEKNGEGNKGYLMLSQTLDTLLFNKNIPYPDLLKLDVQGHELEVLKGAQKSLAHAEVCLLEVSLFDFGDKPPLLKDVVCFMDNKNFQAYDISQFMRRPYDKALFQIDMFFVKKDSPLIADKRWA